MELIDLALVVYVFGVIVSMYGFCLFLWWWKRVGSATDVYIFVAILFVTNAFSDVVAGYARLLKVLNIERYIYFMDCGVWAWRRVPELIILTIIVIRMTLRIVDAKRREKNGELLIGQHSKEKTREEK